jgi:hypothetical protein
MNQICIFGAASAIPGNAVANETGDFLNVPALAEKREGERERERERGRERKREREKEREKKRERERERERKPPRVLHA